MPLLRILVAATLATATSFALTSPVAADSGGACDPSVATCIPEGCDLLAPTSPACDPPEPSGAGTDIDIDPLVSHCLAAGHLLCADCCAI